MLSWANTNDKETENPATLKTTPMYISSRDFVYRTGYSFLHSLLGGNCIKMRNMPVRLINELMCHSGESKGVPCGASPAGAQAGDDKNAGYFLWDASNVAIPVRHASQIVLLQGKCEES